VHCGIETSMIKKFLKRGSGCNKEMRSRDFANFACTSEHYSTELGYGDEEI